eukprot:403342342
MILPNNGSLINDTSNNNDRSQNNTPENIAIRQSQLQQQHQNLLIQRQQQQQIQSLRNGSELQGHHTSMTNKNLKEFMGIIDNNEKRQQDNPFSQLQQNSSNLFNEDEVTYNEDVIQQDDDGSFIKSQTQNTKNISVNIINQNDLTQNSPQVINNELDKFYFSKDKFDQIQNMQDKQSFGALNAVAQNQSISLVQQQNSRLRNQSPDQDDQVRIQTERDNSESRTIAQNKSVTQIDSSNHQKQSSTTQNQLNTGANSSSSSLVHLPLISPKNNTIILQKQNHQHTNQLQNQGYTMNKNNNSHPDTTPQKLPQIIPDQDRLKANMIIPDLHLQMQQKSDGQIVEYGSNTERVAILERKHGGYLMLSQDRLFKYDDLKRQLDFQILKFKDAIYRGQIKNGERREGLGIMVYDNGRIYEGQWQNDRRHGKGFEKYSNQNTYEGDFCRGKAHGYGVYKWKNGETYEGEWINGQKEGQGTWQNTFGESYKGEWRDNKANGHGEHIWSTGDRYVGDWFEFLKHGFGTDFFANGDQYTGQYRYGKPWGRGKYIWLSGATYEGEFEDGKKQGKGRWEKRQSVKDETSGQEEEIVVYYEGEYKNDVKEGYGQYRWASGNFYKGYYKNDKRHFYGEMYWNDGSIYKGEWCDGVQHGYGKMIFATGEVKEGFFDNGVFKFEGNELQIKQYMQMNNIKSSDSEASINSKKYGYSTDSKKNVQFSQRPSNEASFISNANHRKQSNRRSILPQGVNGRQGNKQNDLSLIKNQSKLRKNESVPSLHKKGHNTEQKPNQNLRKNFLSPAQIDKSDSYLQEGDFNPNNNQNNNRNNQGSFLQNPKSGSFMRNQGHSLSNQKNSYLGQNNNTQSRRQLYEQNNHNRNFGLSQVTEISAEQNMYNLESVLSNQRRGNSNNPKLNKVASQLLPDIQQRKFIVKDHQSATRAAKNYHPQNLSQEDQDNSQLMDQRHYQNGNFNNGNNNSILRGVTSQSHLRDIPKPIIIHRPWIPSGVVHNKLIPNI